MKIEYEGQSYEFDVDDITVKQAMKMQDYTGLGLSDWGDSLEKGGNLKALQALGWVVLQGGDLSKPIDECDFKLGRLAKAFDAARSALAPDTPDPTQAASDSAAGSESSSEESSATT